MLRKCILVSILALLILSVVLLTSFTANAQRPKPGSGTATGVVDRTELSGGRVEYLWMKAGGFMYEFNIAKAAITGGNISDISVKGTRVTISYRKLAHSEMDDFYTGDALTINVLGNRQTANGPKPDVAAPERLGQMLLGSNYSGICRPAKRVWYAPANVALRARSTRA